MKNRERFEHAHQFLSGYFHQDWHEDFDEPEEAVAEYMRYANPRSRAGALHNLRQIIAEFQGPDLNRVMLEIGCYYSPERYRGTSMRQWLDEVVAELEQSLSGADSQGE
jgi:hypothetical protein